MVYTEVGLDLFFISILVIPVLTSQTNYLHLNPCFRVSFWEPKLKKKDRKYLEQWCNLPQREEWLWVVISSHCQKFHHQNGSTHFLQASVLKSVHLWVRPKHCFPEGTRTPAIDYFLPLLDHRKQEQSFTLNRFYHPAFHRTSGCLHRNSLYRHICSLPIKGTEPSVPRGEAEGRCTKSFCVILLHLLSSPDPRHTLSTKTILSSLSCMKQVSQSTFSMHLCTQAN